MAVNEQMKMAFMHEQGGLKEQGGRKDTEAGTEGRIGS